MTRHNTATMPAPRGNRPFGNDGGYPASIPRGLDAKFSQHPGYDAQGCHLQYIVVPASYGSSSHGFGCEATGGHCLPCEHCEARRVRFPTSIMEKDIL